MVSQRAKVHSSQTVSAEKRPCVAGLALAMALVLAAFAAHWPALHAGFTWDDDSRVYRNPLLRSLDGLWECWTSTTLMDYWPLTRTTYWIEWQLWGDNPKPYHIANVLLHALAGVTLWRVLKRLDIGGLGAFLAALLFVVHPITVESVAWISERKNVLSMAFYLVSILAYLRFEDGRAWRWYVLSLMAALAALLSKSAVVGLPLVLLICAWWRRGRISRADLLRSVPFFVMSLGLGLLELWFEHHNAIAGGDVRPEGLASRIASVGWVVWFYLYKLLVPVNLAMVYPRWEIDGNRVVSFVPLAALLACFAILVYYRKGWGRGPLAALGSFVVILAPVLGLLDMSYARYSLVADHLQYPGVPGVFALFGGLAGAAWGWSRARHKDRVAVGVVVSTVAIVLVLGALTQRQARFFRNEVALWSHTIALNERAWLGYYNRGVAYDGMGDTSRAMADYTKAIELKPDYAEPYNNRGVACAASGDLAGAIRDLTRAIQLKSDPAGAYINRGAVYEQMGDLPRAIEDYNAAIQLKAQAAEAYYGRGAVYEKMGDRAQAVRDFTRAIELKPDFAEACYSRGSIHQALGETEAAVRDYSKAIALRPDFTPALLARAAVFMQAGEWALASEDYTQVIQRNPLDAAAYNGRAAAFNGMGDSIQAIADLSKAIRISPDYAEAYLNRAIAYVDVRRLPEALRDSTRAIELKPDYGDAYHLRATTYYHLRDYEKAWADVAMCRQLGRTPHPDFIKELTAASGRAE